MSKLILKFKMPKEETEANFALKGGEYFVVLYDLYQKLREITKYENNPFSGGKVTKEQIELAEQIREFLCEKDFDGL
jgi:hypothetical protein